MAKTFILHEERVVASSDASATFTGNQANGNPIYIIVGTNGNSTVSTPPAGFTLVQAVQDICSGHVYRKISDGTETSVTVTMDGSYNLSVMALECDLDGETLSTPQSDENEAQAGTSASSTVNCGSVTPSQTTNACLAIGIVQVRSASDTVQPAIDDGDYATSLHTAFTNQNRAGIAANWAINQTGAQSPTWTWGDTSDSCYGVILVENTTVAVANPGIEETLYDKDETTTVPDASYNVRVLTDANPPVEVIAQQSISTTSGVLTIDSDSVTVGTDYLLELLAGSPGSRTRSALIPVTAVDLDA